jgi:hypothetical protein
LVLSHFFELLHPSDFVASRPSSGDELETVCEDFYETEDISIFAWSSIPTVG